MKHGANEAIRISPRRLRLTVLAVLFGINLCVDALSVVSLYQSRQQYVQHAEIVAEHTATAIDNSISTSLDKVDLALLAVVDELERQLADKKGLDARQTNAVLLRYEQRIGEIEAIRVANAEGLVIFGRGLDPKAGINWADRDYFQFHRDHAEGGLSVTKARIGKVAKKPIVGFSRRYNYPDGRFAGVVSAPVAVSHFTALLSHFIVGPQGAAVLRDADFGLIARFPIPANAEINVIGSAQISPELRALIRSGVKTATYDTDLTDDGLPRTNSFRRLAKVPMIVVAHLAKDDYLAAWQIELRKTLAWMGGFLILSLLAAMLLLRLFSRVLQESQRNQLFLRHSSDGIHILDDAGNVIQVSDQFCRMLGYRRDELLTMNVAQWDARWSADELLQQVLPQKLHEYQSSKTETVHRRKDLSLLEVELNLASFEMDGHRYLFASARDISERKQQQQALLDSEARLRQSEERYRMLLNHLPVGIIHFDCDMVITYANDRFEEIMQVPKGRALHLDCKSLNDQSVIPAMRQALAGQTGHYEGTYVTTFSQQALVISLRAAPVYNSHREIIGGIVIVEDATKRKEAEDRLRLSASVFAHAHEGIMICNAAQVILDVNPTFTAITGYSRDEAIGQTPHLLSSDRQDEAFFQSLWEHVAKEGFWEGELWNKNKSGETYAERLTISSVIDDKGSTTHYIGTFSDISAVKEHQAQLEHLAHYDPLTHLPNRALLADRMSQALAQCRRAGSPMAVCYLDLDGFKEINDCYGHNAGDQLLIEVSERLRSTLRAGDTVARLGGDEFVLLFLGVNGGDECRHAAARVLKTLSAPIRIQDTECSISASIGISIYPDDDNAPDTLLRHADQAMYLAKQAGKNRFVFYDASQENAERSHRETVERIAQALHQGEISLYYQPIVDMRQGRVLGVEGLLRWQHPEHGQLLPAEFLPATEGSALEIAIGQWVLTEGLRQLAEWQAQGLSLQLNLNIATGHLLSPGFVDNLRERLARHPGIRPQHLELEVLEAATISNIDQACTILQGCQQLGVSIAIDDFGTGYSSLAHFRRIPANTLKIDQMFVLSVLGNQEDLTIVDSVIKLTQAFNRKLIAEGIESIEISMLLLHLGCQVGQGFAIARPMPAADLPAWIARFTPDPNWSSPAIHFSRDDIPLLLAELDHRSWVKQVESGLHNEDSPLPPLAEDACRFGHWYRGPGQEKYGKFAAFQAMESTHQAVHQFGQTLAALHQAGQTEAARLRLAELHGLRDKLIEQIAVLQAQVAAGKVR